MKMMRQAGIILQLCVDAEVGKTFLQDDAIVAHGIFLRDYDIGGGQAGKEVVWGKKREVQG
jgi:hypothetical protein